MPYGKLASIETIEQCLLIKELNDALEKMSTSEIQELGHTLGIKDVVNLNAETISSMLTALFKTEGYQSYQLTLIIVNALLKSIFQRGLSIIGNASLAKGAAILAHPIGLVIASIWAAVDIAGPAYRVTVPAVIQIAALRKKHLCAEANEGIIDTDIDNEGIDKETITF